MSDREIPADQAPEGENATVGAPPSSKTGAWDAPDEPPGAGPKCHRWFRVPCYAAGAEGELLQTLYVRRAPDGWIVRNLVAQGICYVPDPEHLIYGYFEANPVH